MGEPQEGNQLRNEVLRTIPGVSRVLQHASVSASIDVHGRELVTFAARQVIDLIRENLLNSAERCSMEEVASAVVSLADRIAGTSLKPVINATGIVLHTNLGRAPLGPEIMEAVSQVGMGYSNLEYDLRRACRGDRNEHVVDILRFLTNAEDALVVNNNAAGIMLTLNTLALGGETVISRGELIEIGGSFRIPEIISASGVRMVEVGTTNRTRLADYERAIGASTASIFKAHQSNFAMIGFTESVGLKELSELAHTHNLPFVYDLGSGLLRKIRGISLPNEPDVREAIECGADIVTFSCDKLLGGPQAGIVAGKKDLISRLRSSPLMRVLRVGKLTLAGLSAVCRLYLDERRLLDSCPVYTLLKRKHSEIESLALRLRDQLIRGGLSARVIESVGQCGGGTLPGVTFRSCAVEVCPVGEGEGRMSFAEYVFKNLLRQETPIITILRKGKLLLDTFTLVEEDIGQISESIAKLSRSSVVSP